MKADIIFISGLVAACAVCGVSIDSGMDGVFSAGRPDVVLLGWVKIWGGLVGGFFLASGSAMAAAIMESVDK